MAKQKIPVNLKIPTVRWLDRCIEIGLFASYSHAGRQAFRLLQENTRSVYGTMNPKNIILPKIKENDSRS